MRIQRLVSQKVSRILLFSIVAAAASMGGYFLPRTVHSGLGTWKGWDLALLGDEIPLDRAVGSLKAAGVKPVWSEMDQTVYLTDFVTISRVPLAEALDRLLPEDPRRTPWLDKLKEYYRTQDDTGSWNILYFPSKYRRSASKALEKMRIGTSWRVMDSAPGRSGWLWASALCMVALFVYRNRGRAVFIVLAALPWAPLWFSGNISSVLAGILGYLSLITLGLEDDLRPGSALSNLSWNAAARALPSLSGFLAVGFSDPKSIPAILLSIISAAALIVALECIYQRVEGLRAHEVFERAALNVDQEEKKRDADLMERTLSALSAVALALLIYGFIPTHSKAEYASNADGMPQIPCPVARTGTSIGALKRISLLVKERSPEQLPDLADAVAHKAFEQAIPFARIGSRRYGDLTPIRMDRFRSEGDTVEQREEIVLSFGENWARAALREEGKQGIGAVLAAQGGILRVEKRSIRSAGPLGSLALKDVFFYIMLIAPSGLGLIYRKRRIYLIPRSPARSAGVL